VSAITVTHFSDPGCPWAWSASPQHAVLQWRYGDQLAWRLVMIGLAERGADYDARGYEPARQAAAAYERFRRFGMPFDVQPRERNVGTGRACRAVVAARRLDPPRDVEVFRALQLSRFTTGLLFDADEDIRAALAGVPGLDAGALLAALEDPEVEAAYQADRAEVRTAEGSPTAFQGKAANTDGAERYTAPSLVFRHSGGRVLEAGGFQPVEAYDVCVANLDPTLERRPPPEDPAAVLETFPYPLTTREVAAVMAAHLVEPDDAAAEQALTAARRVRREETGGGVLWRLAR
jgi:2-hydroxychromene-2-carboxylate isomerase